MNPDHDSPDDIAEAPHRARSRGGSAALAERRAEFDAARWQPQWLVAPSWPAWCISRRQPARRRAPSQPGA